MHLLPQVLIVANAWGAGFKYHRESNSAASPSVAPPGKIQETYDTLRNLLQTSNGDNPDYQEILQILKVIEEKLCEIEDKFPPDKSKDKLPESLQAAANDLLNQIDSRLDLPTWTKRIDGYA